MTNRIAILVTTLMVACTDNSYHIKVDGKPYPDENVMVVKVNDTMREVTILYDGDLNTVDFVVDSGRPDVVGYYSDVYNYLPMDSSGIKAIMNRVPNTKLGIIVKNRFMERIWQDREGYPAK